MRKRHGFKDDSVDNEERGASGEGKSKWSPNTDTTDDKSVNAGKEGPGDATGQKTLIYITFMAFRLPFPNYLGKVKGLVQVPSGRIQTHDISHRWATLLTVHTNISHFQHQWLVQYLWLLCEGNAMLVCTVSMWPVDCKCGTGTQFVLETLELHNYSNKTKQNLQRRETRRRKISNSVPPIAKEELPFS